MTARITVNAENAADILFVPVHAVFNEGPRTFCYRLGKDGKFRERVVVVGRQNEDSAEIISGLNQGDRVSLLKPPPDRILPDHSQVTVNENTHN
jgi:multidrug efflux pump subunit AcrA (membrane-fusion protein)